MWISNSCKPPLSKYFWRKAALDAFYSKSKQNFKCFQEKLYSGNLSNVAFPGTFLISSAFTIVFKLLKYCGARQITALDLLGADISEYF